MRAQPDGEQVLVLNWRDPWHPESGGSELYVDQIVRRWRDDGVAVTWMTAAYPGRPREEIVDGIRFVRRGGHITVYLWAAWLLLTRRLARHGSVLEVQNGMPFLATLFTRRPVTVLVHHVHREQWSVVGPLLARVGWFLESRAAVWANRGNRYIAVSDVTRRELVQLGVDPQAIEIAYNGLPPVPEFERGPRAEAPTLAVLSRLVPHKQIEHVIELVAELDEEFPGIRLRVMGDGWWSENLHELTARLGLEDRVDFLGHVTDADKFAELSRAWVHVLPSVKEGWGLAIVEAGYAETPSVAYRHAGGVEESILDTVTGLLAEDRADLRRQVTRLLRDAKERQEMGEKARVRAQEFTWENAARTVAEALGLR